MRELICLYLIIVTTYLQASQEEEEEKSRNDPLSPTDYYSGFAEGDFFPPIRKSQQNFTPPSYPPMRKAFSDPMPSKNTSIHNLTKSHLSPMSTAVIHSTILQNIEVQSLSTGGAVKFLSMCCAMLSNPTIEPIINCWQALRR